MAKARRVRVDTVAGNVNTFKAANEMPAPTRALSEIEMTHFSRVIKSREMATWSDNDLVIATNLAIMYRRQDELQDQIDSEGYTIMGVNGVVRNPKTVALNSIQSQIVASTKLLGLSASQRAITGSEQKVRNNAEKAARQVLERVAADDLLA